MRWTTSGLGRGLALVLAAAGCGDDGSGSTCGGTDDGPSAVAGNGSSGAGDPSGSPSSGADTSSGSSSDGGGSATGAGGDDSSTSTGVGAGDVEGTWVPIITGEWELGPGQEITSAFYQTSFDHDIYVGAIRPIAPPGTHHTVMALNGFGTGQYVYASGVDTNAVVFPEGVGFKIPANELVILQLHIFNPSPDPLSGISGIEVIELAAEDVEIEADLFLPGPTDLAIPAHQEHTQSGTCVIDTPQTVFALFPHMHQLGSHFKTTLHVAGEPIVIHDQAYEFEHQPFLTFDPIALGAGDSIETECTWNNTTDLEVHWGESSEAEMCFSILFRWPAQAGESFCN
jgi:hypothetical protein